MHYKIACSTVYANETIYCNRQFAPFDLNAVVFSCFCVYTEQRLGEESLPVKGATCNESQVYCVD